MYIKHKNTLEKYILIKSEILNFTQRIDTNNKKTYK